MILTGKAKEDFTKWNGDRQFDMMLPFEYPVYLNALIIEWFDSVGIYVNAIGYNKHYFQPYCNRLLHEKYETRQEATIQAIIKANEIYNERI